MERLPAPALTAAGIANEVLPRRLYQGAVGGQYRYFPHKLPIALDGWRATFVFVQAVTPARPPEITPEVPQQRGK